MNAPVHTLTLHRGPDCWYATTSDPDVAALFDGRPVPTPFLPSVPAETVAAEVARLNPHDRVVVSPQPIPTR